MDIPEFIIMPREFEVLFEAIRYDSKSGFYRRNAVIANMSLSAWEVITPWEGRFYMARGTMGKKSWRVQCRMKFSRANQTITDDAISLSWGKKLVGEVATGTAEEIRNLWGYPKDIIRDLGMIKLFVGKL